MNFHTTSGMVCALLRNPARFVSFCCCCCFCVSACFGARNGVYKIARTNGCVENTNDKPLSLALKTDAFQKLAQANEAAYITGINDTNSGSNDFATVVARPANLIKMQQHINTPRPRASLRFCRNTAARRTSLTVEMPQLDANTSICYHKQSSQHAQQSYLRTQKGSVLN